MVIIKKKEDVNLKLNMERLKDVVGKTIDDKRYNRDVLKKIREETKEDLKYFSSTKDDNYSPFKDLLKK